jgi:hypothetical protein
MGELSKILNPFDKVVFTSILQPITRKITQKISQAIPKVELSAEHIRNTRMLLTREDLIGLLPKGGVVAELGVDEGNFSEKILSIAKPTKLHLIDAWGSKRYGKIKQQSVRSRFAPQIQSGEVEINLGLSTEVGSRFKDAYFDWLYIDTSHTYNTTIAELELYQSKVKPHGIIAGHDFIVGNWNGIVRYGVIEAVYEFCVKYKWELLYITCELNNNPSFAIKRLP